LKLLRMLPLCFSFELPWNESTKQQKELR
jgi:hypothetical protein